MHVQLTIPPHSLLLPKIHAHLTLDTPLFNQKKEEGEKIDLARLIDIPPQDIYHVLHKLVGESVKEGECIASKKTLLKTRSILSPVAGILSEVDHISGSVTISKDTGGEYTLPSFVCGTIIQIDIHQNTFTVDIGHATECNVSIASCDFGGLFQCIEDIVHKADAESIARHVIATHTLTNAEVAKVDALEGKGIVFVEGVLSTHFPLAQLASPHEYDSIVQSKKTHIICSVNTKKIYLYSL